MRNGLDQPSPLLHYEACLPYPRSRDRKATSGVVRSQFERLPHAFANLEFDLDRARLLFGTIVRFFSFVRLWLDLEYFTTWEFTLITAGRKRSCRDCIVNVRHDTLIYSFNLFI